MFGISLFAGKQFCNEVAEYIGVDKTVFSSALLERGVTWAHFKLMKKSGFSTELAADQMIVPFYEGLGILRQKFGRQRKLDDAEATLQKWMAKRQADDAAAASEPDMECVISNEFSSGRYELSHVRHIREKVRGKELLTPIKHVMLSDDLDLLQGKALMLSMGSEEVSLLDTQTGEPVPFDD